MMSRHKRWPPFFPLKWMHSPFLVFGGLHTNHCIKSMGSSDLLLELAFQGPRLKATCSLCAQFGKPKINKLIGILACFNSSRRPQESIILEGFERLRNQICFSRACPH